MYGDGRETYHTTEQRERPWQSKAGGGQEGPTPSWSDDTRSTARERFYGSNSSYRYLPLDGSGSFNGGDRGRDVQQQNAVPHATDRSCCGERREEGGVSNRLDRYPRPESRDRPEHLSMKYRGDNIAEPWSRAGVIEYRMSPREEKRTTGHDYGHADMVGAGSVPSPSVPTVRVPRASTMHNPVDVGELAKIKAKKDAYRRDLEAQVSVRGIGLSLISKRLAQRQGRTVVHEDTSEEQIQDAGQRLIMIPRTLDYSALH